MIFFLAERMSTLALDLEEDVVHLIHEDHCFEHLGQKRRVIGVGGDEEVSLEIDESVGGDFGELALEAEVVSVDQLSVPLAKG